MWASAQHPQVYRVAATVVAHGSPAPRHYVTPGSNSSGETNSDLFAVRQPAFDPMMLTIEAGSLRGIPYVI